MKFVLNDMYGENSIQPDSNHMKGLGFESFKSGSGNFKLSLAAAEWWGIYSLKGILNSLGFFLNMMWWTVT